MLELPRLYLNGFPKSGLHLSELMVGSLYEPMRKAHNWLGTNPWDTEMINIEKLPVLACMEKNQFIKGHSGWTQDLEDMLVGLQIGMVMVYRDLRDVVVSQAYHILSDDERLKHPSRDMYPDDLHEVMKMVITGVGDKDGIFARWDTYQPWLSKSWVLPVKYEDMIKRPEKVVKQFYLYGYSLELAHNGIDEIKISADSKNQICNMIVSQMRRKDTITYRKGKTKQWRYEFDKEIIDLFKKHDKNNVLMQLEFEKNKDWH